MRSPPSAAVVVVTVVVVVGLEREREGLDAEDLLRLTRQLCLCNIGHHTFMYPRRYGGFKDDLTLLLIMSERVYSGGSKDRWARILHP